MVNSRLTGKSVLVVAVRSLCGKRQQGSRRKQSLAQQRPLRPAAEAFLRCSDGSTCRMARTSVQTESKLP